MRQGIGKGRIAQGVMQPSGAEPTVPLVCVDMHRVGPAAEECNDPLDMGAPFG
jgi:hypothetical protein